MAAVSKQGILDLVIKSQVERDLTRYVHRWDGETRAVTGPHHRGVQWILVVVFSSTALRDAAYTAEHA